MRTITVRASGLALVCAVGMLLSSCADFQARMAAQKASAEAAINTQDDSRCRSYGAAPGSKPYFDCRMLLHTQRTNIAAAEDMQTQQNAVNMMRQGAATIGGR
jgi:hypothetical protein